MTSSFSPSAGTLRVLVVEDDPRSRELLVARLVAADMDVTVCADGGDAMEAAHRTQPHVVVSDALMPKVNGFQLCQLMRRDPLLCNVAFILYTATYTADEDRALAERTGADALVVKPDESGALVETIRRTVQRIADGPPRRQQHAAPTVEYFDEYARRMAVKLEQKVGELREQNEALQASEQEVRNLNVRLADTVGRLESEALDRRRVEDALQLAEDVALIGSWSTDLTVDSHWCSRQAASMLGLEPEQRATFTVSMLEQCVSPASRAPLHDALRSDHSSVDAELDIEIPGAVEGTWKIVHLRTRLFRDLSGKPFRRIGTLRDVTAQRKALEKERVLERKVREAQKLEVLGNLAGGIAHDFNNILTAVLSHAQMQQVDLADLVGGGALAMNSAREIEQASLRARDLVSQILTFGRRQVVERVAIKPSPVVAEALRLVRASAPESVRFAEDNQASEVVIRGNASAMHQLVVNLATNAVQAMSRNGGELRIRLSVVELDEAFAERHAPLRAGRAFRLDVSDTGVGMDTETARRIFEPFYSTKTAVGGTGLGLAVVSGIVAEHDGVILVESATGHGTTFSVYLPAIEDRVVPPEPTLSTSAVTPTGRPRRILLVDDEPSVTRVGVRMLEHLGYRVDALTDAREAWERLRTDHASIDLLVTDRSMPHFSGEQLLAALRDAKIMLPCVIMTGFSDGLDDRSARALGFAALLNKPFTMQALSTVCAQSLAS